MDCHRTCNLRQGNAVFMGNMQIPKDYLLVFRLRFPIYESSLRACFLTRGVDANEHLQPYEAWLTSGFGDSWASLLLTLKQLLSLGKEGIQNRVWYAPTVSYRYKGLRRRKGS